MAAKNEGMSTSKKVIAGAAVGVALPAAVGAAKKLIGDDGDDKPTRTRRAPRRSSASRSKSSSTRGRSLKSRATTKSSNKKRSNSSSSSSPTREQLYKMATRLKITGRSSMSKSQLQRAVSRAKSRA
jgi:hypothetical protein